MAEVSRRVVLTVAAAVAGGTVVGVEALHGQYGARTAAGTAGVAGPTRGAAADAVIDTVSALKRSHYAPWTGTRFTARLGRRTHTIRLERILDVQGTAKEQAESCFNLVFTATSRPAEGIYTISRRGVPTQSLFLGHLGDERSMQALVNRSL